MRISDWSSDVCSSDLSAFAEFMKDAQLMIQKPSLLVKAVNMIHELPLTEGDTKGALYEYLLSKLTTAGINGQFRTRSEERGVGQWCVRRGRYRWAPYN